MKKLDNVGIVDKILGIRVAEFIACDPVCMHYWDYLQKRKDSILRVRGLNPEHFTAILI